MKAYGVNIRLLYAIMALTGIITLKVRFDTFREMTPDAVAAIMNNPFQLSRTNSAGYRKISQTKLEFSLSLIC